MKSENWRAWMLKGMSFHAPNIDLEKEAVLEDLILSCVSSQKPSETEVRAWGWQVAPVTAVAAV